MIVNVRNGVMIRAFFRLSAIFMRVHECGVVVVVCVVVRAMCELTERTASVLVGHVPVVVAMDLSGMAMLVGLVADNFLFRVDCHASTSFYYVTRRQQTACAGGGRHDACR